MNQPKKRRNRVPKPKPTAEELRSRLNVSIEEAMILTGFGRQRIVSLCDGDDGFDFFYNGSRRRIITDSILAYQNRQAAKAKNE